MALADRSADGTAVIAALGARQLACSGPENLAERDIIAMRMVEMGLGLRRTATELRGRLWVIDTLWERGDLAGIAAACSGGSNGVSSRPAGLSPVASAVYQGGAGSGTR